MNDQALTVGSSSWPPRAQRSFPIVGVGASEGGLDSFRRLLGALPPTTGMAYVFVQHLDPDDESILTAVLSRATQMVVAEVSSDVSVQPNTVYVIPPSRDLIFVDGTLKLIARGLAGYAHLPVDSFLLSLAKAQGSKAIGVILSGLGSDGTLGLAAIEAQGGIAFVQEPSSARHDEMPLSAIAAGGVDYVLRPEEIARELIRLGEHPYMLRVVTDVPWRDGSELDSDSEAMVEILEGLKRATGTSFGSYKKTTLRRRIARRMAVVRVDTLTQYARYLEEDPREKGALYDDCLISVTSFFRDPEVFEAFGQQLATLLKDRTVATPFRIWVPGCATGEEAYSLAICLLESCTGLANTPALQIFATDLSEHALAKAREGVYPMNIARDVSADRLRRFFVKNGDQYQIAKSVREMCVFARHDLTRDPPFSHLDLISCRNLLIYLEPALQEMVLATFHYALSPGGWLLLGPAESVIGAVGLFSVVDERHRLYAKKANKGPPRLLSASRQTSPTWTAFEPAARKVRRGAEVSREADRIMLARFGPAAVVIDDHFTVLEFRGDTDPFLDHGLGKATLNLERLLRRGLLLELREVIAQVRATGAAARRGGLRVRHRQQLHTVAIEVIPIHGRVALESCLLIAFELEGAAVEIVDSAQTHSQAGDNKDREIERLSEGLGRATDYMHSLLREHETAVAELQATTEEAVSSNEELQSLNEELQTAKEEIQSTNEELATLNQELQERNAQLARFNEDIQRGLDRANTLVDTVPLPLVILDHELRVETANVAYYEAFRTTPRRTRDRLFAELGNGQWDQPELLTSLQQLIVSGKAVQELTVEANFLGVGERTMSLNARRIHGERGARERVLLAIEDRTAVVRAERGQEALFALEQQARQNVEVAEQLKDQFVATVSHELREPLSVISSWVDVLSVDSKDQEATTLTHALAAIRRGVAAQTRLISDLLDHSRSVMGRLVLERSLIDLVAITERSIAGVRAATEAKGISISLCCDSPSCLVLGDSDRMQQLIWNLLLNAIKFTASKGRVAISIGRALDQVHVTFTDTGIGIAPHLLPHVFERFRQADGSGRRAQGGLGLGLKLVSDLVELHGGTVHAHSPGLNRGSTFVVVLPVPAVMLDTPSLDASSQQNPVSRRLAQLVETAQPLEPDALAGTNLLVVDSEPDARDALVGLFQRYGAHVRTATSLAAAIDALEGQLPDVLISDLGRASEDGYELMRSLRSRSPENGGRLPALAISAYDKETHQSKAIEAGFQKYLEKPVAPGALVTAVALLSPNVSRRLALGASPASTRDPAS